MAGRGFRDRLAYPNTQHYGVSSQQQTTLLGNITSMLRPTNQGELLQRRIDTNTYYGEAPSRGLSGTMSRSVVNNEICGNFNAAMHESHPLSALYNGSQQNQIVTEVVKAMMDNGLREQIIEVAKEEVVSMARDPRRLSHRDTLDLSNGSTEFRRNLVMDSEPPEKDLDNHSWAQWLAKSTATQKRRDFAEMMWEMLHRRKGKDETMTAYYHAKLALCARVNISGENAVSCIIDGLPSELRRDAHNFSNATPEALYQNYLAKLYTYKDNGRNVGRSTSSDRPRKSSKTSTDVKLRRKTEEKLKRCYNCQELADHVGRDCPKPRVERCKRCGDEGHWVKDCPMKRPDIVDDGRRRPPKRDRERTVSRSESPGRKRDRRS